MVEGRGRGTASRDEALGAPGAGELTRLSVSGVEVAVYVDGAGLDPALAPRPFLHPVRSLAGTRVSAASPEDHRWHLGVGVAVQDVDGRNFWGGRTYVRDHGYQWRDDHGRIRHLGWSERAESNFVEQLGWYADESGPMLTETRTVRAAARLGYANCWVLEFSFALRNETERPVLVGSPATNGREGAGYGGFFWRMPNPTGVLRVSTPHAEGESEVHGRTADWLAVRFTPEDAANAANAATADGEDPAVTLVFEPIDRLTAVDPWFVRVEGHLGVGSSLASVVPVELAPGEFLQRAVRTHVIDGDFDDGEVDTLIGSQRQADW